MNSLSAITGNQAMQQARAGLLPRSIFQAGGVAADANTAGTMYPDQAYPANAGPELVAVSAAPSSAPTRSRARQKAIAKDRLVRAHRGWCGSRLRQTAQLLRDHEGLYPEAGAAGVHFEDQLASESAATWAARC